MYGEMKAQGASQSGRGQIIGAGYVGDAAVLREEPVRDKSEVERELDALGCAGDELKAAVARLLERLAPVLVPRPEGNTSCGPQAAMPGSVIGNCIQQQRFRLHAMTQALHDATDALAV